MKNIIVENFPEKAHQLFRPERPMLVTSKMKMGH